MGQNLDFVCRVLFQLHFYPNFAPLLYQVGLQYNRTQLVVACLRSPHILPDSQVQLSSYQDSPAASNEGDAASSGQLLDRLIYHVFLPPKVIQGADTSVEKQRTMISSLLESVREFSREYPVDQSQQLKQVIRMLQRLLKVKPGLESSNKRAAVQKVVGELENGGMFTHPLRHLLSYSFLCFILP